MSRPALTLLARARDGDRAAIARLISTLEARAPGADAVLSALVPRRQRSPEAPHVIGITGPPGAGKSTFVDALVALARARGQRVAVLAVDPSSPRTGGAILGDRIRMESHAGDAGVYVRSLGSRGYLGGLSRAAGQVVELLDDLGFDLILVETVGVGQGELAVLDIADSILVVLTPESGDTVQTMKAGLLEIADIFCVNKADRPGAEHLVRDLELSVHLDDRPGWQAPVCSASALQNRGVSDVLDSLDAHHRWLVGAGRTDWAMRRADGRVHTFLDMCGEAARSAAARWIAGRAERDALRAGTIRPESLVADALAATTRSPGE